MMCSRTHTLPMPHVPTFLLFLVVLRTTLSAQLSVSLDYGQSWRHLDSPSTSASSSHHALLRISPTSQPTLYIPNCALEAGLEVSVLRVAKDSPPLALRVDSAVGCYPHVSDDNRKVIVRNIYARSVKPNWQDYVYQPGRNGIVEDKRPEEGHPEGQGRKRKGFFAKYGLYIMLFFGFAMAQGIRKGMAELREEMEREEAAKASTKKSTGQVKVVVPRRKGSVRNRKKQSTSSASK